MDFSISPAELDSAVVLMIRWFVLLVVFVIDHYFFGVLAAHHGTPTILVNLGMLFEEFGSEVHSSLVFDFLNGGSLPEMQGLQLVLLQQFGDGCIQEDEPASEIGNVDLHGDFLARVDKLLSLGPVGLNFDEIEERLYHHGQVDANIK